MKKPLRVVDDRDRMREHCILVSIVKKVLNALKFYYLLCILVIVFVAKVWLVQKPTIPPAQTATICFSRPQNICVRFGAKR